LEPAISWVPPECRFASPVRAKFRKRRYVRYMDDIVLLARTRWAFLRALAALHEEIAALGLHLHRAPAQPWARRPLRASPGFALGVFERRCEFPSPVTSRHVRGSRLLELVSNRLGLRVSTRGRRVRQIESPVGLRRDRPSRIPKLRRPTDRGWR
jgi:hypothetical protein